MVSNPPAAVHRPPLLFQVVLWSVIVGFVVLMIVTLIPSVSQTLSVLIHCPGAASSTADTQDGGEVRQRSGRSMSTTVTSITCFYADERSSEISNDTIFLTGIGVGAVFSVVAGFVIALVRRLTSRPSQPPQFAKTSPQQ